MARFDVSYLEPASSISVESRERPGVESYLDRRFANAGTHPPPCRPPAGNDSGASGSRSCPLQTDEAPLSPYPQTSE